MSNRFYWSNEVATILNIGDSTLRKWCLQLERCGVKFLRDENGRRAFNEGDILLLREMQGFLDRKMTMEDAAQAAIAKQKRIQVEVPGTLPVPQQEQRPEMRSFEEAIERAATQFWERAQAEMEQRIRQQVREEMQEQFDRFKQDLQERLVQSVKEIAAAETNNKKGFFGRLFRR